MKTELLDKINNWISNTENIYDQSIKEKVYWNMLDLKKLINDTDDIETLKIYNKMFERFQYYK